MPEEQKIKFSQAIKESWNKSIGEITEEIKRDFYEYLACKAKTIEEISALREGLTIFIRFEKLIKRYSEYSTLKAKEKEPEKKIINKY